METLRKFCIYLKNHSYTVEFSKFISESFHRDTDKRVVSTIWNSADWKSVKWCVAHLTKKKQNFAWLPSGRYCAVRAQNLPSSAPDNVLRALQISFKLDHFRRIIVERVNTAKTRRKVNPIFGWSLPSSRIIRYKLASRSYLHALSVIPRCTWV